MKHYRYLIITFILLMFCMSVSATDYFTVDGIKYVIYSTDNRTVAVARGGNYTGDIEIPATVNYNNVEYSVIGINGSAFDSCKGLTSITIPNSLTFIGYASFSGCSSLTSVSIGSGVTSIDRFAFDGCSSLTTITIDEGNTKYDSRDNCNAIIETASNTLIVGCKTTNIPNSVMGIGYEAFRNCKSLTSITIPNNVTSIGDAAFHGCSGLTSVTIPNGLTNIGQSTFDGCYSLTSITIPNSVTNIGYSAFSGCSSLTSITIPNSVTSIGAYAFSGCSSLTSITIPNSVTTIKDNAFGGCKNLTSVTIGSGVTSINSGAFDRTSLVSITVDGGNTTYDSRDNCNAIIETASNTLTIGCKSTIIPNSITTIGESAYYGCSSLTSITIPTSVTTIGENAFKNCTALTSVTIPNNVTSIGENAFKNCTALTSVTIPNSVTSIGESVFSRCSGLTSITIPNSVTSIGSYAFSYCSGLTSISIPNSVTSLGGNAFYGCSSLTSVTIGSGVTSISSSDFDRTSLVSITVDGGNTTYDSRDNCNAIIETASNTLIIGCENTIIPNSVTTIVAGAFYGCSGLTSITIPSSVTSIDNYAFYDCSKLTSVTVDNSTPVSITSSVFSNRTNATLYVPAGSKAAYEVADYWKDFKEIIEMAHIIEVTDISQMDNVIYIEPMEVWTNTQKTLSLKMKNSAAIRGFQFDLYLPEGVTVVKSSNGRIQGSLSAGRLPDEDAHTLTFSEQADGAIRFLCSSLYDETFTGNNGEIATLQINIPDGMIEDDYPIQLKNIKMTETNISNYYETPLVQTKLTVSTYVSGDISGDGVVDVSDYTGVANFIHGNTPEGFNAKAADVDGNNAIDVSDYTGIANIIHTGSIYGSNGNNSNNAPALMLSPRKANTDLSTYDNVIYISPFTASAGTQTSISIKMKNTAAIRGFQFDLYLPDGMSVVKSNLGRIQGSLSAGRLPNGDEHTLTFSEQADGAIRFLCSSQYDETFMGNDGEIATLQVNIDANMANGDYPLQMKNMKLTETDISKFYTADLIETTVTIGTTDTRTVLDETFTTAPASGTNVDVRVRRKIKADEWSTLCLPFAMDEMQVKAAFGDDVQLAEFKKWEATDWDANDNTTAIDVTFANATAITANKPYIIKVSQDINEFTADGVDIAPEDEPTVSVGKVNRGTFGSFTGSYVPITIDEECLFLSENKFWYSTGKTKMKAYRAYFYFQDVLVSYSSGSSAKIGYTVDNDVDNISLTPGPSPKGEGSIYDLQGRKIKNEKVKSNNDRALPKGVYIVNGKKVVIK